MPQRIDLAAAWDWEYDAEFLSALAQECDRAGVRFLPLGRAEAADVTRRLRNGTMTLGTFLDRSAPDEEPFISLLAAARESGARILNHPDHVRTAVDKATMHLKFLAHGIDVPYTIIISPFAKKQEVELSLTELAQLGRPFIVKPANTTGGVVGVILGAETLKDVIESRQHHKNDKYLLQEKIIPETAGGRRRWFRVFYVCGRIIPCWWDDLTHVYAPVSQSDMRESGLDRLQAIAAAIRDVCGLDFFSTEVAVTVGGRIVTVDYVNEVCDMRLQSLHPDGVPDAVVRMICATIVAAVDGKDRSTP